MQHLRSLCLDRALLGRRQRYLEQYVQRYVPHRGQVPRHSSCCLTLQSHFSCSLHPVSLDPFRRALIALEHRLVEARRQKRKRDSGPEKACRITMRNPVEVPVGDELLELPACTITIDGDKLVVYGNGERRTSHYSQPYEEALLEVLVDGTTLISPSAKARPVARLLELVQTGAVPAKRLPTFAGHCVWCNRDLSQPKSKAQGAGDYCHRKYGQPLEDTLLETEVSTIAFEAATLGPREVIEEAVREGSLQEGLSTDDLRELLSQFGVTDFDQACSDLAVMKHSGGRSLPEPGRRLEQLCFAAEHLGGSLLLTPYIAVLLARHATPVENPTSSSS